MNCCCDTTRGLTGLGALDPIHVGAPFSLGVEISGWWYIHDMMVDVDVIRLKLDASGYVQPGVQVYQMAGVINPFIVVEGRSGREYGSADHLKDAVLSVIASLNTADYSTVRFEAQTYSAATGSGSTARYDAPLGGSANYAPAAAGSDGLSSALDQLAVWMGVSRTQAALIGAGGALVGILLLKRLF